MLRHITYYATVKNHLVYSNIAPRMLDSILKRSDPLCKVFELSMQFCGKLISDSFETY